MNDEIKRRLEQDRVTNLIESLRAGNVVTTETLVQLERMSKALTLIAGAKEGDLAAEDMAQIARDALAS